MKHLLTIMLFLLPGLSFSQDLIFNNPDKKQVDSLQLALPHIDNDTLKMLIYSELGGYNVEKDGPVAADYYAKQITLTRKLKQRLWEAQALLDLSYLAYKAGNYPESLKFATAGMKITEDETCEKGMWKVTKFAKDGDPHKARLYMLAAFYEKLGYLYQKSGDGAKSSSNYFKGIEIAASVNDEVGLSFYDEDLGDFYIEVNKLDSALYFLNKSLVYSNSSGFKEYKGAILTSIGLIYFRRGDFGAAKKYYCDGIKVNKEQSNQSYLTKAYILLANLYQSTGKSDSAIYYASISLRQFKTQDDLPGLNKAYITLFTTYKSLNQKDSAFLYLQRSKTLSDNLNKEEKAKLGQFLNIGFTDQLKVQELEKEKIQVQNKIRTYIMLAGIFTFLLIALLLYRNNGNRKKANTILTQQKEKVESTLDQLKSTQIQLIQREKMASLGELTAGIAHEIQNPLNFVNNFSEVNKEMLEELKAESTKPKAERSDQLEIELINDLIDNEQKINHHGKRADSIVKGMLEHSRTSTGEKQLTDLNVLCDEFFKLSYHGLRAKDKEFNAEMVTHFDAALPKLNIAQQDIGRVLLNLFNNAFYAVNDKKKTAAKDYKPAVEVSTSAKGRQIEIRVKDNGNGIPDAIKDKIMQPFFTTKPTGEGTGLGLSLSYDIVVKGHGGSIDVNTKEGEFTEFVVILSIIV